MAGDMKNVGDEDFFLEIIESDTPALVDFWAT